MIFKLACGDVMPGCSAHFENADRRQLMADLGGHAASAHGITSISPDMMASIENKISIAA